MLRCHIINYMYIFFLGGGVKVKAHMEPPNGENLITTIDHKE